MMATDIQRDCFHLAQAGSRPYSGSRKDLGRICCVKRSSRKHHRSFVVLPEFLRMCSLLAKNTDGVPVAMSPGTMKLMV